MRCAAAILAAFLALIAGATKATAERLVASVSNHRVLITSSFAGEELVVFGSIEPDSPATSRRQRHDLVITVTGPPETLRTRRKERVFGIWANTDSRLFIRVPSYLAVLSNRPHAEIASPETLRRLQIGTDNIVLPQRIGPDIADVVRDDPFRQAFIRLQKENGLYRENQQAVTFLTPTLFRATIPLPGNVPTGAYSVDVLLFADGASITRTTAPFEIIKAGFEQYVADAAQNFSLLYGIITAMMALLTGWFASIVFRRD